MICPDFETAQYLGQDLAAAESLINPRKPVLKIVKCQGCGGSCPLSAQTLGYGGQTEDLPSIPLGQVCPQTGLPPR